jgi:hypothetical protein
VGAVIWSTGNVPKGTENGSRLADISSFWVIAIRVDFGKSIGCDILAGWLMQTGQ